MARRVGIRRRFVSKCFDLDGLIGRQGLRRAQVDQLRLSGLASAIIGITDNIGIYLCRY